ncbi:MAG: hypothetical protein J7J20_00580 [Desulfurococcales archaeon]|nr:hypothetical protein [Desulfurococcales archaeon]
MIERGCTGVFVRPYSSVNPRSYVVGFDRIVEFFYRLAERFEVLGLLRDLVREGLPLLGTCAGRS